MANWAFLNAKPDKLEKKKTICATWDEESGSEEDSDNREAMLCFVGIEKNSNGVEENNPIYDDLLLVF